MLALEKGKRALVIGLGVSGLAAARFLHDMGLYVSISESRPETMLDPEVVAMVRGLGILLETGGHSADFCRDVDLIVPSPGVPLDLPVIARARQSGAKVAGELALAAGRISSPVIGITGSNGKTTVTSLIGHLLQSEEGEIFVGGNIGTPVLDYLRGPRDARGVVLELSSFQLEIGGDWRPDIGLLLNLSPDHIDRHGSLENYAAAKRRIFTNQTKADTAIVGSDDPLVMLEPVTTAGRVLRFGLQPASEALVQDNGVLVRGSALGLDRDEYYDLAGTPLASLVNRLNAAAAVLAARVYGCSREAIQAGLRTYVPPAHRMALVAEMNGVRYVDDSKGTNIGAVNAALASSGDRVILIAGGRDKKSDFSLLADQVRKHVLHLVLIGEAADRIEESLGTLVPVARAATMAEAVRIASEKACPGDTVLLSPACASFDMFDNYAHRGEVFAAAVADLRQKTCPDCC